MENSFNFHHSGDVEALAEWIGSEDPRAALLSGERASGRRYLMEAAVAEARASHGRVRLGALSLDGYEAENTSLADFLAHQAAKRGAAPAEGFDTLLEAARAAASAADAPRFAAFALALDLLSRGDAEPGGLLEALRAEHPLEALFAFLTEGAKLVIHSVDGVEIPDMLRDTLRRAAAADPHLRLAYSITAIDGAGKFLREFPSARFEMLPLDENDVRAAVSESFEPNEFPEEVFVSLHESSRGFPGLLAAEAERLVRRGVISRGESGAWQAAPLGMSSSEPIEKALSPLGEEERNRLRTFLHLAALCGDNVPVDLLLASLGVDEEDRDAWVDRIDETVGADSELALFAERFQHPSFPGRLVYGFRRPLAALGLRRRLDDASRARLAAELFRYFSATLPPSSRAAARLYIELCRHMDAGAERRIFERALLWWVPPAEAEALTERLVREIEAKIRTPRQLWRLLSLIAPCWPAYRVKAIADAVDEATLESDSPAMFKALRASLLLELDRFEEAAEEAAAGLKACQGSPALEFALLDRLGRAQQRLGRAEESAKNLAESEQARRRALSSGAPEAAASFAFTMRLLRIG